MLDIIILNPVTKTKNKTHESKNIHGPYLKPSPTTIQGKRKLLPKDLGHKTESLNKVSNGAK